MKGLKKSIAMFLFVLMVVSCIAGCQTNVSTEPSVTSSTTQTTSESTTTNTTASTAPEFEWEYMEDTSSFEFEVYWAEVWGWAKAAVALGWDDADIYKLISEKTGGKMNINMPAGTDAELVPTMIASGTYSDCLVFSGNFNGNPYVRQMRDAGLIYSWSELIDANCPKMWTLIRDSLIVTNADENGILWAYPGFSYHEDWYSESNSMNEHPGAADYLPTHGTNVMFVRKDILTAYGAKDITSLEDFTNYLRFVKQNYPEMDPLQLFDGDPRGNLFIHMKSTFGCHLSNTYPQADNSIKYFMYDPHYVDYLKWLNGLYRDGVITANQLTDDQPTIDTKLFSAQYGSIMSAFYVAYNTLKESIIGTYGAETDKIYVSIGPVQKEGIPWKAVQLLGSGYFSTVITKKAKNPDRIIKFFEFLMTDLGQMTTNGGIEGLHWTRNENGSIHHDAEKAKLAADDLEAYVVKYRLNGPWAPWCNTSYWEGLLGAILSPPSDSDPDRAAEEASRLGSQFVKNIWAEGFAELTSCIQTGSDLDVIRAKADEICKIAGMQMIAAESDSEFNEIYNKCISEIEALGIVQIENTYTIEHQKQRKNLGLS